MKTKRLTISKTPQCRHDEDLFVTYLPAGALFVAFCSNCGSTTSVAKATRELARYELMRIEVPPLVL